MKFWPHLELLFFITQEVKIRSEPFWAIADVIIAPLVAEEHVLVTPARSNQLRFVDDLSDVLLFSAWLALGIDIVQDCVNFDSLELLQQILHLFVWKLDVLIWHIPYEKGENRVFDF